jgi:hypothetical protein
MRCKFFYFPTILKSRQEISSPIGTSAFCARNMRAERLIERMLAPPPAPTLILCGASTPPKSKAEMAAIPSGPKVGVQWVAGSLGLYEERAVSITAPIATFLAEHA